MTVASHDRRLWRGRCLVDPAGVDRRFLSGGAAPGQFFALDPPLPPLAVLVLAAEFTGRDCMAAA